MMSRSRDISPALNARTNFESCRHRESPDLLFRCVQQTHIDSIRALDDSPSFTDIIVSEDDTDSFHSDSTYILSSDVIIDNISENSPKSLSIQQNSGFIKCKSLDKLLPACPPHQDISKPITKFSEYLRLRRRIIVSSDESDTSEQTPDELELKIDSEMKIMNRNASPVDKNQFKNVCIEWIRKYPGLEEKMRKNSNIRRGQRFNEWEDRGMIWYLLKTNKIGRAKYQKTWSEMMKDGYLKHRSMRSLQNHFVRKILPKIGLQYNLPAEIVKEFENIEK